MLTGTSRPDALKDGPVFLSPLLLVYRAAKRWMLAGILVLFAQAALPVLSIYVLKLIIDQITLATSGTPIAQNAVLGLIVLAGGIAFAEQLLNALNSYITERQTQLVVNHVTHIIHLKALELDLEHYESPQYQDEIHLVLRDAPHRPQRIVSALVQIARSALSLVAIAALLVSFSVWIAVGLALAAVPGFLFRLYFSRTQYAWQRKKTSAERELGYVGSVLTYEYYAKEVKLFNLGRRLVDQYDALRGQLDREQNQITRRRLSLEALSQFFAVTVVYGAYALIAGGALAGAITLGSLVMYFQAFQRGQSMLQDVLSGLASLYESRLFLTSFYRFLELRPKVTSPATPVDVPKTVGQGLAFRDVRFQYASGTEPVLNGIDLTIGPGETIALVGANGAGKTTLIKLLCRLYDPDGGSITLDGIDLRQFELGHWRRQVAVVFQDYVHYFVKAWENIWYGDIDSPPDRERIVAAAKRAGAHDMIEAFEQGYDTMLGNMFLKGHELSIGQWQRIALARAFLRDAPVVVLDEPTSALDVLTEEDVIRRFRQIAAGRMTILISHRLSTVRMADRIYVLDGHRICESGTHDALMAQNGLYAHLFNTQASHYNHRGTASQKPVVPYHPDHPDESKAPL